jgi:hypothetical protein
VDHWVKWYDAVSDSCDWADAANANPKAAILFVMMLPNADPYGIISGQLSYLRGSICQYLAWSERAIGQALAVLEQIGMVVCYQDGRGHPLIYIPKYHEHQSIPWERVGPPRHDLPPGWLVPDSLPAAMLKNPSRIMLEWWNEYSQTTLGVVTDPSESTPSSRARTRSSLLSSGLVSSESEEAAPVPEPDPADRQRDLRAEALAGDGHMLLANNPQVRELVARCCPHFTGPKVGDWATALLQAIRDPNTPLTREEWLAEFEGDPPTASRRPAQWVDFHELKAKAVNGKRAREGPEEPPMVPGRRPVDLSQVGEEEVA